MTERLQKVLAHAGVASRRRAERMIEEGRVAVNGTIVRRMGTVVDPWKDAIAVDGVRIRKPVQGVYLLVNKPRGVLSTVHDPEGRPTVIDMLGPGKRTRLYPVGRLDFLSEGLLILTNDGELTRFMTRAGTVPKVYRVKVTGTPAPEALNRLRRGIVVDGERFGRSKIEVVRTGANTWLEVTLKQGRNRQIRTMFEAIGHRVLTLRRIRIGFLHSEGLKRGACRELTRSEVEGLYKLYGKTARRGVPQGRRPARSAP